MSERKDISYFWSGDQVNRLLAERDDLRAKLAAAEAERDAWRKLSGLHSAMVNIWRDYDDSFSEEEHDQWFADIEAQQDKIEAAEKELVALKGAHHAR